MPAATDNVQVCEQVAVCTPGRMIDLIKMKACNMLRVTYLVFDEADRMFDMGFEPQVSLLLHFCDHIKNNWTLQKSQYSSAC